MEEDCSVIQSTHPLSCLLNTDKPYRKPTILMLLGWLHTGNYKHFAHFQILSKSKL